MMVPVVLSLEVLGVKKYRERSQGPIQALLFTLFQADWEDKEMKARQRSLGNIRFIGELYKLKMLTARIMHGCVTKLLTSTDEESLECLCRLLTTVGKDLEAETKEKLTRGTTLEVSWLSPFVVPWESFLNNYCSIC